MRTLMRSRQEAKLSANKLTMFFVKASHDNVDNSCIELG
jgi:hypothetical protein